jgi:hypothetical protein
VVVAAAALVQPRAAPHLAGDHQQGAARQAAPPGALQERRDRVVHLGASHLRPPMFFGLLPLACMSQPQSETVTKPQPASHSRRASSICRPSRFDARLMSYQRVASSSLKRWLVS